jgi:hypothetical protein
MPTDGWVDEAVDLPECYKDVVLLLLAPHWDSAVIDVGYLTEQGTWRTDGGEVTRGWVIMWHPAPPVPNRFQKGQLKR